MAEDTAALQAQIDELKQQLAQMQGGIAKVAAETPEPAEPAELSRRGVLGKAAAVAAGAVGGAMLLERPAAAADGGNLIIGQVNAGSSATTLNTTVGSSQKVALLVNDNSGFDATGSGRLAAIAGWSGSNVGVYGFSASSYPLVIRYGKGMLFSGGLANAQTLTAEQQSVPTGGAHNVGEYVITSGSGSISACIVSGTPGTWANIGFNPTTGAARVLDTRTGTGAPTARFNSGEAHTVAVRGHATIPDSTSVRAVSYSITVNNPGHAGYLKIGPDSSSQATVVNFTKGVSISASGITGLKADGSILVTVLGASADVVIDLTGYFV